jgi:hypothetical protein
MLIAVALVAAAHASSGRKPSAEQVFVAPRAQAENVRFAQSRPGLIEVTAGFWRYGETVTETGGVAVTITQIFLRFLGPDPFPTAMRTAIHSRSTVQSSPVAGARFSIGRLLPRKRQRVPDESGSVCDHGQH